jgi:pimeloyl-ACP methyl ester carboxylesterase
VPKVDFVGHSMGCSVLWSYIDLFGQETINRMIFIDEPPALWANPADSDSQVDLYGGFRLDIWAVYNDYKEKAGGDVLLWKVLSSRGGARTIPRPWRRCTPYLRRPSIRPFSPI